MSHLHRFVLLRSLVSLSALLLTTPGTSEILDQNQGDGKVVYELGEIEIVGIRERLETSARSEQTAEEFDRRLDESVVEAIERVPGVVITFGSKNEPALLLRGLPQRCILVLYDGVPLATPYFGDVDLSELPLENLAKMKVVRGNASVLYGPNALGGVLSLVSAKPGVRPNLNVLTTVDIEGNHTARISHGARRTGFYYQVSAGLRRSNGWRLPEDFAPTYNTDGSSREDGGLREHSGFDQLSAGVKLGHEWESSELSLSASFVDANKEIPPSTSPEARARYWDFPEWKKSTAVLAGRFQPARTVDVRGNVYYHTYDNVLRSYNAPDYHELRWESTYDDYSAGLISRVAWSVSDRWKLRSSVNISVDNHSSQSDVDQPWQEYIARTNVIAVEGAWNPRESVTLQFGLGGERYDFDTARNINASGEAIVERTKDIQALTFSGLASYVIDAHHRFIAGVSSKTRFPTMHELFSNIEQYDPGDVASIAPEEALEYSIGYTFSPLSLFSADVSVFRYDIDNLIDSPNRDVMYANIEKAIFQGIELWGSYGASAGVKADMAYTYTDAGSELPGEASQRIPHVPLHTVHVDCGYAFVSGLSIMVGYTYRSEVVEYDGDQTIEIPAYALLDLSARHDFSPHLGLTIQATNLLDKNYYQEIGFERPGRNLKLGIQYSL